MKRQVFNSFIVFGLGVTMLFSLNTCKDPDTPSYECTPDITVLLPEKAVSTFFFKGGTYWIYQREDSLYTDSVWVTSAHQDILPVDTKSYGYFQEEKCYESRSVFISSREGYFFFSSKYSLQERAPKENVPYSDEWFSLYETPTLSSGNSPQVRIEYGGNELGKVNSYGDSTSLVDSMTFDGAVYTEIIRFKKHAPIKDYLTEAYYAPRFGMIRFKDNDGAYWNLIRSNILQ